MSCIQQEKGQSNSCFINPLHPWVWEVHTMNLPPSTSEWAEQPFAAPCPMGPSFSFELKVTINCLGMKTKTNLLDIVNFCKCCGAMGLPFCTAVCMYVWKKDTRVKASEEVVKISCKIPILSLKERL